MHLALLFHTVRHLRPTQVIGQLRNRLRNHLERPASFSKRPTPDYPNCNWRPRDNFLPPGSQENSTEQILGGSFSFINLSRRIAGHTSPTTSNLRIVSDSSLDWQASGLPKLWQYNLHYFEWLWALDYDEACLFVEDWIREHPMDKGRVGWEPYPTSLRLMNWCGYFFGRHRERTDAEEAFREVLWQSVWRQAEWLTRHLEFHLLGNHLLENAAALCLAGACFNGADAQRWLDRGLQILREQTDEQILDDGMHFELSPMYHSRICYLFLMLVNTGNAQVAAVVQPVLGKMLEALRCVTHPDGDIALLSDSAFGIYNKPQDLREYGESLGIPDNRESGMDAPGAWALPEAGYYGFRSDGGDYLICDAGRIGPDYIPGHAHADVFSFEISLNSQRVIVDSGVHDYEQSEERTYCRSTRAHNTVEIEGHDQAEMWGAFRVARRGHVCELDWEPSKEGFELSARHDGYQRLPGRPIHHRKFQYRCGKDLKITDSISASRPIKCRSYLHLHPDCICDRKDDQTLLVRYPRGAFRIQYAGQGRLECRDGWYYPEFNTRHRNTVITYSWDANSGQDEAGFNIEMHP